MDQDLALGLFSALVKFSVFLIFISGIVEALKVFLYVGFKKMLGDLFRGLFKGAALDEETIRFLTFVVAMVTCYAFDYGLISRVVEGGAHMRPGMAGIIDYVGTSASASLGAAWIFDRYVKTAQLAAKAKQDALKHNSGA